MPARKRLGMFYTPDPLAQILVEWALLDNLGDVLDPSFGGCSFLRAAHEQMGRLGVEDAGRLVHGIDVDELGGRRAARSLEALGVPRENFLYSDFFRVEPDPRYAAVVGNPPYIRHHDVDSDTSENVGRAMGHAGLDLSGRASLWAPFVVHSVRFLKEEGRLALVLPGAVLQAEYAEAVMSYVSESFAQVSLFRLGERVFADAQEESVVMLASGHGTGPAAPCVQEVGGVAQLRSLLSRPGRRAASPTDELSRRLTSLPSATRSAWVDATSRSDVTQLGNVAKVRIGVVTGANDFFVRAQDDALVQVARSVPIISRSAWLDAPIWTGDDQQAKADEGKACRLLTLKGGDEARLPAVRSAIDLGEDEKLDERSHMERRPEPWWALADFAKPDAFLRYMGSESSRIVLNDWVSTCTNAVHRIFWEGEPSIPEAVVLSSWTSLFALGVELHGRHYGGGVLKIEPTPAALLPVVACLPQAAKQLAAVDAIARRDGPEAAVAEADRRVLVKHLGVGEADVRSLRDGIVRLGARRSRR